MHLRTAKLTKPCTPKIFLECYCVEMPIRHRTTKLQQLVCGFVVGSGVLIFSVIGPNTINIPEIFLGVHSSVNLQD